jgi:hypothetical protein
MQSLTQSPKGLSPPRNTLTHIFRTSVNVEIVQGILGVIQGLDIQGDGSQPDAIVVSATQNTWSRAARRGQVPEGGGRAAVLVCRVVSKEMEMRFEWLRGWERVVFEGFVASAVRRIEGMVR